MTKIKEGIVQVHNWTLKVHQYSHQTRSVLYDGNFLENHIPKKKCSVAYTFLGVIIVKLFIGYETSSVIKRSIVFVKKIGSINKLALLQKN